MGVVFSVAGGNVRADGSPLVLLRGDVSAASRHQDIYSPLVSSGLFVGKEGPMIHSGAVVGAGLPQVDAQTHRQPARRLSCFPDDSHVTK